MCCYDTPAHMTEEMKNASKEAPKAIIMSVYLGAITGFIFLVSAFFCIGDLEATATTSTGVPLIEIFYNSTGSVAGANVSTLNEPYSPPPPVPYNYFLGRYIVQGMS